MCNRIQVAEGGDIGTMEIRIQSAAPSRVAGGVLVEFQGRSSEAFG